MRVKHTALNQMNRRHPMTIVGAMRELAERELDYIDNTSDGNRGGWSRVAELLTELEASMTFHETVRTMGERQ